jgi:glycosyltransferase involved in cell wall biosynthesis
MAFGLPAIVSDASGIHEMLEHGETGFVVRAGDIDGLCAALASAADSRLRLRAMGRAARELVQPQSWRGFGDRLVALLEG